MPREQQFKSSIDGKQLDVDDEGGATGDARLGELAVAHFGRDIDLPSVGDMHLLHGDDPVLDEVPQSASQRHVATAAVKLFAVDSLARIMGSDHAAGRGSRARLVSLSRHLIIYALGNAITPSSLEFAATSLMIFSISSLPFNIKWNLLICQLEICLDAIFQFVDLVFPDNTGSCRKQMIDLQQNHSHK